MCVAASTRRGSCDLWRLCGPVTGVAPDPLGFSSLVDPPDVGVAQRLPLLPLTALPDAGLRLGLMFRQPLLGGLSQPRGWNFRPGVTVGRAGYCLIHGLIRAGWLTSEGCRRYALFSSNVSPSSFSI